VFKLIQGLSGPGVRLGRLTSRVPHLVHIQQAPSVLWICYELQKCTVCVPWYLCICVGCEQGNDQGLRYRFQSSTETNWSLSTIELRIPTLSMCMGMMVFYSSVASGSQSTLRSERSTQQQAAHPTSKNDQRDDHCLSEMVGIDCQPNEKCGDEGRHRYLQRQE